MKKIMSLILTSAMLWSLLPVVAQAQSLAPQGPIAPPTGWTQYSPMESMFRVSGSDKTFILLDKTEDGYLVFSYDDYGKKAFDEKSGVVFDVNSTSNIGYFLNNEFLLEGFMDTTVNGLKKLPEEIIEHLNEHIWETEPVTASASETSQRAKVALMSQTEYVQYAGKFGAKDNSRTWMFRTARALTGDGKSILRYFDETAGYYTSSWPSNTALYIRPIFYLDDEFFSAVKLNSAYMGKGIKEIVASAASEQLLGVGYTQDEIETIKNTEENSVVNANIVFPEESVYTQETSCSVTVGMSGSYSLTVSGDGYGSVSFSGKDGSIVAKKCDIKINGSGKKKLVFTLKKDGETIESIKKEVFCADVYNKRPLDSGSTRGVYMDLSRGISNTDLTILNSMGAKKIKIDFSWEQIEPEKGQYNFSEYESIVEKLTAGGIEVWIALSGDNKLYSADEKEIALSAVSEAIIKKFPAVAAIELPQATDASSLIVGGYADNRFAAVCGYDTAVKWFRPFYETVNDISGISEAERLHPYGVWIPYSRVTDENGQTTDIFNDIEKLNKHTQGYISAMEIEGGTGYITTDGLKIIGNRSYTGAQESVRLNNGMSIYEGFSEEDAVALTALSTAAEIRKFTANYQDELSQTTQTSRMLYRLEQVAIYFEQRNIALEECKEKVNQIGEVGTYLCNAFKNGSISTSQDKIGEVLTDLYGILHHSAAICVCFGNSGKEILSSAVDFNGLTDAKTSGDPLVRSAYIRCAELQKLGALAASEQSYAAVGYYDILLKNLCQWNSALLKGDNSAYELFQIKDNILLLEGVSSYPGEKVTITVKNDDMGEFDYVGQKEADENGGYIFTYKMKNQSGSYTLAVRAGSNTIYRREFIFFSKTDEEGLIKAINTAENENDILTAITEYSAILRIYSEELSKVSDSDTAVLSCILSNQAKIDSVEKLVNLTHEALLSDKLYHAGSAAEVKDIIERYAYLLQLESRNSWKTYQNLLNSETQNKILSDLAGKKFNSVAEVTDAFDSAVILRGTEGVSYRELMAVLTVNNNILGIDFSNYEKLTDDNRNSMLKEIAGKKYSTIEVLKQEFENKAMEYLNQKTFVDYSGGGGGGASSGGSKSGLSGISVSPPSQTASPEIQNGFSDLEGFEWASDAIKSLYKNNIVNGVGNNCFEPRRAVKREEFIKMIVLAFDFEIPSEENTVFKDIPEDGWALPYICSAVDNGIVMGETENLFGYGKQITREDATVILYRAAQLKNIMPEGNKTDFTDFEAVSDYAKTAVASMSGAGIINGMGNGAFMPKAAANRAQAAKLIYELLKRK